MDGYFVWGGSIIFADGQYHLFAARWPTWRALGIEAAERGNVSLLGKYRDHSEIVRAVADNPVGPYVFQEVALKGRGGDYWDGRMCHNPRIVKTGDTYVLYYIGRSTDAPQRKIGYARAPSVKGPWQRIDRQLPLTDDANNPAPYIHDDGAVLLAFRDHRLQNFIARAPRFDGEYQIVSRDIVPGIKLEDPGLWFMDGLYHMVIEDNAGGLTGDVRHGAHLYSTNGLEWARFEPVKAYTHTVEWRDGTQTTFDRRERPELLNLGNPPEKKYDGFPTHLITGVLLDGRSRCLVQEIK